MADYPEDTANAAPQEGGYSIAVKRLADGQWLAAALDLGIRRQGKTRDEAVCCAREAVRRRIAAGGHLLLPGSNGELAFYRSLVADEGRRFEESNNPVFAFCCLAYALAGHPDWPIPPLVRQYFIELAQKMELLPGQLGNADAKKSTENISQILGFSKRGRNAIKVAKGLNDDENLALTTNIESRRTGKTANAIFNDMAETEIARPEHKATRVRALHRKAARGRRD